MRTGELGFWWRSLGGPRAPRAPLAGPLEVDVAIVGAGYTGLWSAYHLKRAEPALKIVVLEREVAGFGASGRNGGWVSGFFSGPARAYERHSGAGAYMALQRAMFETVDEVGGFLAEHGRQADFVKGGLLEVALNAPQLGRLRGRLSAARSRGLRESDLRELSREQLAARVDVAGARGALFSPHVARVQPAKLLLALADTVAEMGVDIHERTPVSEIRAHAALTPAGVVRARWVVRATEGYTPSLRGLVRRLAPLNSSMIITAVLEPALWDAIGWSGSETMSDGAHAYAYLQRTADGRIAIGGRGAPYRYGSRTNGAGATAASTVRSLHAKLLAMFPELRGVQLEHAWSGVLGVPRDWCPSVGAERDSGIAWAGGYVGEGVAASNLAARTLRDLLLGRDSALTRLPWVGRLPRSWEPEPLRWAGIRGAYALYRAADRAEQRSGRPSRMARALDVLSARA
jgi:glycine/D-amino acid oxidase-like deaminating enzyme